jgi:hypothetical protein
MFALIELATMRWRKLVWLPEQIAQHDLREDNAHVISELPVSLAVDMVDRKVPHSVIFAGMTTYAERKR